MALIKELKGSFVGGQVSPELQNRIDLEKFNTFLKEAKNTKIKPEGGISNRAGTVFIGTTKVSFKLTINVNVSATIIINGQEYTGVTTKSVNLEEGSEYTYSVSAVGYNTVNGSGTITADDVIDINLEVDTNSYVFTIDNGIQGATIKINGIEQSTVTEPAGTFIEWKVSKTGYVTQSGSLLLSQDTTKEVILETIKYKIYYFYYDTNTQSTKFDLFKEVDEYNFKDVVPEYTSRTFVADGCVYQVQNGSFVKLVDGGCSSCSFTFYVKNGVIYNTNSASYNDDHTWSRVGYCGDINKLYALTTDGKLYVITTQISGGYHDLTSTISLVQQDVVDFKCSGSACLYYRRFEDSGSYKHYILWHNGTTETQIIYGATATEEIGIKLVNAGTSIGYGNASIFIFNNKVYVGNSAYDNGTYASGWYNKTYSTGYFYYIKDGKLRFRQKAMSSQEVDGGTTWTDVSINLSASVSRNVGNASLAICNNNLYFIDQYTQGGDTYLLETPTLINGTERFIEVYTLRNDQSTDTNPVMFAIAREL